MFSCSGIIKEYYPGASYKVQTKYFRKFYYDFNQYLLKGDYEESFSKLW